MEFYRKVVARMDPFYINYQILFLAGFGYFDSGEKWKSVMYKIYRFLVLYSMTQTYCIQLLDVYLLLNDFGKLVEDLCAIIVTFMIVIKMNVMIYRTTQVENLQREFMRFRVKRTHPEEEEIWDKASRMIYVMTKTFYMMGVTCVIFWISYPIIDVKMGRKLPFPWVFPIDFLKSPYYESFYVFQALSLFSFLINIVSVDVGYCSYVVLIAAQYDILVRDLRVISSAYDERTSAALGEVGWKDPMEKARASAEALREVVKSHNKIIEDIRRVQAVHGDIMFWQMNLSALLVATLVVDIVVNSRGLSLKLFQRILYVISGCFDSWLLCYWGTVVIDKSYMVAHEIYNCAWMRMDTKVRKTLLLIMMRAQRAPKLQCGLLTFQLPLFLEIMKCAYNAAALLKNTS